MRTVLGLPDRSVFEVDSCRPLGRSPLAGWIDLVLLDRMPRPEDFSSLLVEGFEEDFRPPPPYEAEEDEVVVVVVPLTSVPLTIPGSELSELVVSSKLLKVKYKQLVSRV